MFLHKFFNRTLFALTMVVVLLANTAAPTFAKAPTQIRGAATTNQGPIDTVTINGKAFKVTASQVLVNGKPQDATSLKALTSTAPLQFKQLTFESGGKKTSLDGASATLQGGKLQIEKFPILIVIVGCGTITMTLTSGNTTTVVTVTVCLITVIGLP